ncbi:hypothetical protein SAMN05428642_101387 [Flaviramulus basaltis]|uniref:Uncharacterized protein n=1 Tax=Flaviramulus basaltis TaxID=369401 RepID=A0A1K2IBD1_9FLAO|nr:BfmA/BtgA family mobilization protein [Flaviramulus basaltis]SFZ89550.1 hypothetical protein SAMN05428642_101387 [Flaviramulus basaltis]
MEDAYQKYRFSAISIKKDVAHRFREFSKEVSSSHTVTLTTMLDFFEVHQMSPLDSIDGSLGAIEMRIKKRIGQAIAIIRDIEKSQTLPTVAMLQSLFEQQFEVENDNGFLDDELEFTETKFEGLERGEPWAEETTVPKIRYDRLEEKMDGLIADFNHVLYNVKEVKSPFGKTYLKLELLPEEIAKYKRNIKNVKCI